MKILTKHATVFLIYNDMVFVIKDKPTLKKFIFQDYDMTGQLSIADPAFI